VPVSNCRLTHARSLGKVLGRPRVHDQMKMFTLHQDGKSYREIQKITGAPLASISKAIKAVHQRLSLSASLVASDPVHHSFVKRTAKSFPESEDSVKESDDTDLIVKPRTLDKV